MLNSRQRAQLKGLGNKLETIIQIGKSGITENLVKQVEDALSARELIKGRVLESSEFSAKEAGAILAEKCKAEVVQSIGSRFILYRESKSIDKEKRIKLVK